MITVIECAVTKLLLQKCWKQHRPGGHSVYWFGLSILALRLQILDNYVYTNFALSHPQRGVASSKVFNPHGFRLIRVMWPLTLMIF